MNSLPKVEQALINLCLSPDEHYKEIIPQLTEVLFTDDLALRAYKLIKAIMTDNIKPNLVTLNQYGRADKTITAAEVAKISAWGSDLWYNEPINDYIALLKDEHIKRSITSIMAQNALGLSEPRGGATTATEIIKKLNSLLEDGSPKDSIIEAMALASDERDAYYRRSALHLSGKTSGLNTGLKALNKFTGGFHPELIILAGRPSMGKTALALYHAVEFGEPGIYFNLEMNKSQLCQRLILQHANDKISSARLRDGNLTQPELYEFERSIGAVEQLPILIYDKARCGVHEAVRVMRREVRKNRCKWAIIDYLQLMTIEGFKGGSRELEVAEISRTLKAAQKELNIPIIALAQLSRQVEQRADKKPILSDLRESGSIEQDADTVIFIWRPAYYGLSENGIEYTNDVFYLFEKHRQGATGEVRFKHNETLTIFTDAASEQGSTFLPLSPNYEFNGSPF